MTDSPRDFAVRPSLGDGIAGALERGDVLSELLAAVRLRGDRVLDCSPPAPVALSFDHSGGTLHIVERGQLDLEIEGSDDVRHLERGDVVLLAGGRRHALRAVGGRPRWLCGTFVVEDARGAQILAALPPLIELKGVIQVLRHVDRRSARADQPHLAIEPRGSVRPASRPAAGRVRHRGPPDSGGGAAS